MCAFRSQRQADWLRENKRELYEEFKRTPPEQELRARGYKSTIRMRKPRRRG